MTDEEVAEYNRLCDEYNRLVAQNRALRAEIATGIENCYTVASNIGQVGTTATKNIRFVSSELNDANDIVERLHSLLIELTENYFLFKSMSEASKKLSSYTDEYNEKYRFFNELRRITLGYVIGLDSNIVSSESLRKKVEKVYLANTDYWLAYAAMAVMLWASDEPEAAYRALNKSLSMDCYKSCVFFMLINLRFGRTDVARNWYITLLDKTDVNNMQDEWQYVLHAYLIGAMKGDGSFHQMVKSYFDKLMEQTVATSADFTRKTAERAKAYAAGYIHTTQSAYPTLSEVAPEYRSLRKLQSEMEKIGELAKAFDEVYAQEDDSASNLFEQIENILYNLINSYDDNELIVVKELKLNEAIMASKGNMEQAMARFNEQYGDLGARRSFGDLMLVWAFTDDYRTVSITVRRFALFYLKDRIAAGMADYFEEQYRSQKEKYQLTFELFPGETYEAQCGENDYQTVSENISQRYRSRQSKYIFSDKQIRIFGFMVAGALAVLAIAGMTVGSAAFPVFLVLGIVLGAVGGFLFWRRFVDLRKQLEEKCRLTLVKLWNALEELREWRRRVGYHYGELDNLKAAIERF